MLTHDRINSIDVDIRLLYYIHLPKRGNIVLKHDMDAIWRYRTWEEICGDRNIIPTDRNIKTLILEAILDA